MSRLDEGAVAERLLPDGDGELCVYLLLFGAARLTFGRDPEDGGYDDCWDYPYLGAALDALVSWNGQGEPEGWTRHPISGRRRPDGDPSREYVWP